MNISIHLKAKQLDSFDVYPHMHVKLYEILQIFWLLLQTASCKGIPKSYLNSIWGRTCHMESIE